MVNGKQFTITWHVDYLKLSHVDAKEVDSTIEWLKSIYGAEMRVSREKNMNTSRWTWIIPYQER
jgi:hypothetical protein